MANKNPLNFGDTMYVYTDGACRGNPGPGACAYVAADENGSIFSQSSKFLGNTTNNRAEYHGVLLALEDAVSLHRGPIKLRSDSQLVVRQVTKEWRVKNEQLKPLYDDVMTKLNRYDRVEFAHVPRDNKLIDEADTLCNEKLDKELGVNP